MQHPIVPAVDITVCMTTSGAHGYVNLYFATSNCLDVGMGNNKDVITGFATLIRTCRNGAYKLGITYFATTLPPE